MGGLDWMALHGVGQGPDPDYAATVPHLADVASRMMFAVITPGPDHRRVRRAQQFRSRQRSCAACVSRSAARSSVWR